MYLLWCNVFFDCFGMVSIIIKCQSFIAMILLMSKKEISDSMMVFFFDVQYLLFHYCWSSLLSVPSAATLFSIFRALDTYRWSAPNLGRWELRCFAFICKMRFFIFTSMPYLGQGVVVKFSQCAHHTRQKKTTPGTVSIDVLLVATITTGAHSFRLVGHHWCLIPANVLGCSRLPCPGKKRCF